MFGVGVIRKGMICANTSEEKEVRKVVKPRIRHRGGKVPVSQADEDEEESVVLMNGGERISINIIKELNKSTTANL